MRTILFLLFFAQTALSQQLIRMCENTRTIYVYYSGAAEQGSYYWSIDGGPWVSADSLTVNWSDYEFGKHTLELTFQGVNCEALPVDYTVTTVECPYSTLYIPNSFTPNGDQHNDVWAPIGYNLQELKCTIYNRWGIPFRVLNSTEDVWDGTLNGEPCPEGIYVYCVEWRDHEGVLRIGYGHITLIR